MSVKAAPLIFGGLLFGLIAALFRPKKAAASNALPPIRLDETVIDVTPPGKELDIDEIDVITPEDIAEAKREAQESATSLPSKLTSVIPGVDDVKWTAYVHKQKQGKLNGVTKSNSLGLFLMGYRMLQDLGYVRNSKKVLKDGRQVWEGEFIPPLTLEKFLSDAMLQYEAFAKMTAKQVPVIQSRYGSVITGSKGAITLSGLLNVAKVAGMGGLDAWLKEPATRKPDTTKEFNSFNGIF